MKKSFYWSLALVAGLLVAGVYSTNVFAEDVLPTEPEVPPAVVEEALVEEPVAPADTDADTVADDVDNCVDVSNEDQADADQDGEGDACDEQSSDEGEVEGAVFSALRGGHNDDDDDNGHINICHILGNGGYNQISVSKSGNLNGHNNHGADIIPPFEKSGPDYPGKNWTTEGQAIWNNGCQPLPETGSITIVKVIADGSNQDSEFTFTPNWKENFSLGGGDSNVSSELEEGVYTIIETVPDGWNYPTVECTDQSAADDGEATINLDEGEDVTCTFTNSEEEVPPPTTTTIHAQKIICDEESDLPNWGAGSSDITSTTASDWLAEHDEDGCYLAEWDFEWSYRNVAGDPDDNTPGFLGGNWYPFVDGEATVDVSNDGQLGIREVFDEDYIPFTGQNTDQNVSAEMYCGDDVLHYDNWEWINATAGQPIYCVAWNVPVEQEHACRVQVVSQTGDEGVGNGNAVAAWIHTSWTHALESVATWIWDSYEVVDASQTEAKTFTKDFYVDGPVNDAMLKLAADNRYWITINGNEVASNTGELNYGAVTGPIDVKVTGNIQSGWNTITMKVENIGLEGYEQRPHDNPAAGIYELVINAEEKDLCEQPEEETSEVTICKYENSLEGNLLSDWDVWLDHWAQDDFKATIVIDGHDYEGTTEENGCVTIADVPYGSYRLDEIMKDGWVNVSGAGSQVVVDSPEETFNLVNAHECNPNVNLIKNGGFEAPVVTGNGGDWQLFANGDLGLEWVAKLASDLITDAPLEIQAGYSGWITHDGSDQFAELDSTASTIISQDVETTPGNTYRLTYWRAARPGTVPAEDNAVEALVNGSAVDSSVFNVVSGNPDWYQSPNIDFTATGTMTSIALKDIGPTQGGSSNSYGTFVDDVALYCVPPVVEHHNHVTICKAEVGHDGYLSGWTVGLNKYQEPQPEVELVAINDEREYEGVTGEDGCVTFTDVDLAEYYVEEDMQDGWEYFSGAGGGTVWNIDSDQGTYTYNLINQRTGGGDDESCLVEGYKYDEDGVTPLAGWFIGLEGYYYPEYTRQDIVIYEEQLIGSDVTDENGYYCIQGEVEGPGSNYSVYEVIQEGWDNIGAEINDDEVSEYYDNGDIASVEIGYLGDGMDVNFINQYEGPSDEQCSDEVDNDNDEEVDENDSDCQEDTPETPNDDDNGNNSGGHNKGRQNFGGGEVLGATTENNFCPFLRDYQHIKTENDPSEVNKAKAFFNSYLGLNLLLNGVFDMPMFNAVVQFQNMFKPDVLDTWTEEYPGVLNDNATGYLYQTTKWKINSIICPGYETFPDQLIIAPGTTI